MPVYVASTKMGCQPPLYHVEIRISELGKGGDIIKAHQGLGGVWKYSESIKFPSKKKFSWNKESVHIMHRSGGAGGGWLRR